MTRTILAILLLATTATTHAQTDPPLYVLSGQTNAVELFNVTSGTYVGTFAAVPGDPRRLQYSTTGTLFVSHSAGIDEFDATNGTLIREVANYSAYGALLTPLNTLLVSSNGAGDIFELEYGDLDHIRTLTTVNFIRSIDWADNGNVRISSGDDYLEYTWPSWSAVGVVATFPGWNSQYSLAVDSEERAYWAVTDIDVIRRRPADGSGLAEDFVIADGVNLLDSPTAVTIIPSSDNLLVFSSSLKFFYEFDGETGALVRRFGPYQQVAANVAEMGFLQNMEPPMCSLEADIDGNGSVDITDLAILLANFGCN